jgi:hypothetical protein
LHGRPYQEVNPQEPFAGAVRTFSLLKLSTQLLDMALPLPVALTVKLALVVTTE